MTEQTPSRLTIPSKLEWFLDNPPKDAEMAAVWAATPRYAVWTDYQMPHLIDLLFPKGPPPEAPKGAIRDVTGDTPSANLS